MQLLADAKRHARAGWRHRWKALALSWAICLGGWAYVHTMPDQFRASTRIYADADAILGQLLRGIAVDSASASQVELLQRTLLSRPNLEWVATRTGMDLNTNSAAAREGMLAELGRNIRITAHARNLFSISYTDSNAQRARDVVQAMLTRFMEQATANDRQQMDNARSFVAQQVATYEAQLREAEQRRADFRARYLDLLPSDAQGASRLDQGRTRLQNLRGELQDAVARRESVRQYLASTPATITETVGGGGGGGTGDPRLLEAERQLRNLRLQYTDQHPAVIAARNALAEARSGGSLSAGRGGAARPATSTQRPNPAHEPIRVRLIEAEGQVASLERQVRDEEAQVERLESLARSSPQLQAQFQNLDRDYNVLRRSYEELLERRESVQIAGAARTGADRVRLEVVDPPFVPPTPAGPNRPRALPWHSCSLSLTAASTQWPISRRSVSPSLAASRPSMRRNAGHSARRCSPLALLSCSWPTEPLILPGPC
jgi:polysaccharide chain length determinant protein (PEP-CTERM system associated)